MQVRLSYRQTEVGKTGKTPELGPLQLFNIKTSDEVLTHLNTGVYIFYFKEIWPKGLRGKENKNLLTQFVQKMEQTDQKCVYF